MTVQLDRSYPDAARRGRSVVGTPLRRRSSARRHPAPVPYRRTVTTPAAPSACPSAATASVVEPEITDEVRGYRMGRWARLTVTLSVLLVAVLLATGTLTGPAVHDPSETVAQEVTVSQGDTLWSIARSASADESADAVAAVVARLVRLNGLHGMQPDELLPAGIVLRLPPTPHPG